MNKVSFSCYRIFISKCISVAAVAADYTPASYSNYGSEVWLCAPGGDLEYYGTPGMSDDAYDANGTLKEQGAIYSTLVIDGVAGYGYYEGTSMACPHVSGIAALGLAYAKQQHRHFTSEEFRELMYTSARDIEEYFVGEKLYYMRHESAGATPIKMNLAEYRGKMGRLADAGALLKAIEGCGRDMRIPNICIAPDETTTLNLGDYLTEEVASAEVADSEVAIVTLEGSALTISAKREGQTSLTITTTSNTKHHATITVREGAANGWL